MFFSCRQNKGPVKRKKKLANGLEVLVAVLCMKEVKAYLNVSGSFSDNAFIANMTPMAFVYGLLSRSHSR